MRASSPRSRRRPRRRSAIAARVVAGVAAGIAVLAAAGAFAGPTLGGCPVFPADNVWNVRVDALPVDANSAAYVATIGAGGAAHPDFGTVYEGAPNGIPFVVVAGTQPRVAVKFDYADESDPGPYPVPPAAPIEGGAQSGGDRHVLVVDAGTCTLYELYAAYPDGRGGWLAGSGAVFDLAGNALRPATWTSADAAGLPILPGLVRYDEVAAGEIAHALRFTAPQTRNAFVWPARHEASSRSGSAYPPMGQRFRLKAAFDVARFGPHVQVILRALQRYGMFLADNGSSWYLSGAPDPRWDDDELHQLGQLHGSDFEAVDESALVADPDSARVAGTPTVVLSVPVVEYYRAADDHYFVTAATAEIEALDGGRFPGWARTGETFAAFNPALSGNPGYTPVCRYYGRPEAGLDSHFYSASPAECAAVAQLFPTAWSLESANVFAAVAADPLTGACPAGTRPLYRVYDNRRDANHRYTPSLALRAQMLAQGWIAEGYGPSAVAMCIPP